MAQIKTKFNVGDRVVTLDKNTKKMVEITIGCIMASVKAKETTVSIYPCKPDGEVDWYTSYDEMYCFTTGEELINYIKN